MFLDRPHQTELLDGIDAAWSRGAQNVMATMATGGGKTHVFGRKIADTDGPCIAIAHRQELVGQMSLAMCRNELEHGIVGPEKVIRSIVQLQIAEFGRSYYHPNAHNRVAGVDTLNARADSLRHWTRRVRRWVIDEGHHVLAGNKWGRAAGLFPAAQGLLVTATAGRADGYGLGRHADGIVDELVEGADAARLIAEGWLTSYRVVSPPGDFVRPGAEAVGSTGDIKHGENVKAVRGSSLIGDVVKHYERHAPGRKAVLFATDVASATDMAARFRGRGWRAEVISAKTPDRERAMLLRRFRAGEIDVLLNVDLFGEGFDLPAIEVVIMARPTESLPLYLQQFGRALRPVYAAGFDTSTVEGRLAAIAASECPQALIIDHVGNVQRHLLPDTARHWTLDRTRGTGQPSGRALDAIPLTTCEKCESDYERFRSRCPLCGHKPEPASRAAPEFVDGDLVELDAAALDALRGRVARVDSPTVPQHLSGPAAMGFKKRAGERIQAQYALRESIAWWGGYQRALGRSDSESYRRFYHTFGTDVLSAQTLGRPEAEALTARINAKLAAADVKGAA